MGLETGTYINSLVSTNPLGSDERSKGDDHIRLVKATIKASFPDVDEAVVTIHNGTSAPSTPQTGTVWRDTTNSLWKFYNGSGWITLAVSFSASNSVDVNAGTVDGITLGTNSAVTEAQIDNININGNAIISSDTDGDITITPNGAGEIVLDGQKWPQADGGNTNYLTTNGSGQIAWTTNTVVTSETNAATSATTATTQAGIATAKAVLTAADAVSTAADVVSTNADVVSTNADVVSADAAAGAVAFKFTYDSTTSMANPTGTGGVRFDSGTLSSITNIAFDAVTADTGNPDISPLLLSIDDGSNDTHEGYIFVRKSGDLSTYIAFNVTGTVVDNTSWLQVPCTHSSSNGTISNGDTFYISFVRSGNVGATGATGPSGGVGNELADNVFRIQDNSDATKEIAFEASGITTGTTRTITMPDSNVTLGTPNNNTVDETKLKDALVADFTEVTVATGDSVIFGDATASGNTKRDTVQGILDLVPATDTSVLEYNIAILAFKVASANQLAKFSMVDQVIDEYQDATGIDAGASTNELAGGSGTAKYYEGGTSSSPTISITGTGNTTTTDGDYSVHKFITSGNFVTDSILSVEYLVVAGGGAGGGRDGTGSGGGGGAGGYLVGTSFAVSAATHAITVGDGGASVTAGNGPNGSDSVFSTITSTGGGGGGFYNGGNGQAGGSGGGGATHAGLGGARTASPVQGNNGGDAYQSAPYGSAGGGGGAGSTPATSGPLSGQGGTGGIGLQNDITGTNLFYAAGGGGAYANAGNTWGQGGSGIGGEASEGNTNAATAGAANTGSGGGGTTESTHPSGAGGKGIVVIRRITSTTTLGANLTLQSVATTAESAPTTADLVVLIEDGAGTATINTDIKAKVSRDGSAFSGYVTFVDEGDWGTNKRILVARNIDISGIATGTAMKYKLETLNQSAGSKETRIHATSLAWA
jgi:hypothetical protein